MNNNHNHKAAAERLIKYYEQVFKGVLLDEGEWWAHEYREDVFGTGFGGIKMKTEVLSRDASEHGGLHGVVIEAIEEKADHLVFNGYFLFRDKIKEQFIQPMELEGGKWKISSKGYLVNRFAP